jgi:uncharacterized iron-regulated membrane protein
MWMKARDIPFAFSAITIALLMFAVVWTAPSPQLCPNQDEQSANSYQALADHPSWPATSHQPTPSERSHNCDEHAVSDWWMIRIGLVTAIILLGQLMMFWRQLNAMRDGVKDAADAAKAATRQAEIAENTFNKTERPWIFLTDPTWKEEDRHKVGGLEPELIYKTVNAGKLPGIIDNVFVAITNEPTALKAIASVDETHPLLVSRIVSVGENRPITEPLPEYLKDGGTESYLLSSGRTARMPLRTMLGQLYVRVVVYYDGPFTTAHYASAAWQWTARGFVRYGGDTYNFSK